jgi:hypothetical protein
VPRQARLDVPGTLHHVRIRGIERSRIINDVSHRKTFVSRLDELAEGLYMHVKFRDVHKIIKF